MDKTQDYVIINPKIMAEEARKKLAWQVFSEAHVRIFAEPGFDEFYKTVFTPSTYSSTIILYAHDNKFIGYTTFQVFQIKLDKEESFIIMCEMGISDTEEKFIIHHPSHLIVKEVSKFAMQHLSAKIYIIDALVSPFLYRRACNMLQEIYPRENIEFPETMLKVINQAANHFHWEIEQKQNAIVRHHLKWRLHQNYLECVPLHKLDNNSNFYKKLVPKCASGDGLVIIIPVTLFNVMFSIKKTLALFLHHKWNKFIKNKLLNFISTKN